MLSGSVAAIIMFDIDFHRGVTVGNQDYFLNIKIK